MNKLNLDSTMVSLTTCQIDVVALDDYLVQTRHLIIKYIYIVL